MSNNMIIDITYCFKTNLTYHSSCHKISHITIEFSIKFTAIKS